MSNWTLKDGKDKHVFEFPNRTLLPPNEFLIITEKEKEWKQKYGDFIRVMGDISFGFNVNADQIRLYDTEKLLGIDFHLAELNTLKDQSHSWLLTSNNTYQEGASSPDTSAFSELRACY